jgi:hypothetical protein
MACDFGGAWGIFANYLYYHKHNGRTVHFRNFQAAHTHHSVRRRWLTDAGTIQSVSLSYKQYLVK